MIMKRAVSLVAACALCAAPLWALAENATHVDGYSIHHNAFTTDTLAPEVAKTYHIQRSKHRGLLNVTVIKDAPSSPGASVEAKVKVDATNLSGQVRNIDMREVKDGSAVYYIGDFHVSNEETLTFRMQVTPAGAGRTYQAQLTQEFFTD
jgi:Domain of unknown function (DUF4426)